MDRLRLGLLLLALAPAAWLVGVLVLGYTDLVVGLACMLVGLALAAWAQGRGTPWLGAVGFTLAAVGVGLFYDFAFFGGLAPISGLVYLLGCLVALAGVLARARSILAMGLAALCLAGLGWIVADGVDGLEWQAGNVLTVAGGALGASGGWTQR